ncbi:hypothetical protein J3R83DRAFT_10937 [Lanmaoa asiatica]|nr:hypothetical protein J3R83DRAFT_10937 [Lanmaoa asiatica]
MFAHKHTPKELLNPDNNDSGYLEGRIFMVWAPRNGRYRIQLEVSQDSALHRFVVEIPYRDDILFRSQEYILLALKGVKVVTETRSKTPFSIPILLRFPDSVVFKYLTGINAGKVIDTREENTDKWSEPGTIPTVSEVAVCDGDRNPRVKRVRFDLPESPSSGCKSRGNNPGSLALDLTLMQYNAAIEPHILRHTNQGHLHSGGRQRKRKRLNRECVGRNLGATTPHQELQTPMNVSIADTGHHASIRPVLTEGDSSAHKIEDHDFTQLSNLGKGDSRVNLVGVVVFVNPTKMTKTKEWHCSFSITDASVVDSLRRSITVNCFQKKHMYWLPQVQKDDIIILRQVKIAGLNGALTITGYGDTLRWAIYDPLTHSIRSPEKELTNRDGSIGSGLSSHWSALQGSAELEYCKSLAQWWDSRRVFWDEGSAPPFLIAPSRYYKKSTTTMDQARFMSQDYTANLLAHPLQATWCPPELYGRVLRFEMWGSAQVFAKDMKPGEYWYLPNVRAKWNATHYMEGTIQLAERITRLDESAPHDQPCLEALLRRKCELGLGAASATLDILTEKLPQEVMETASHLICTVELLHDDDDSRDGRCLYVTDYTYNPNLPSTGLKVDWVINLDHRVLKIVLDDAQNLAIEHSNATGLYGYLGGQDVLVQPLHNPSDQRVQTLSRNKSKWRDEINGTDADGGLYNPMRQPLSSLISLQEALARPAPDVFKVRARAVDYFPFALEDTCALRCIKCEPSYSSPVDTCPKCGDRLEWFYCLFIQIQDEKGGQLITSLSGKECKLLQGISPTNFRDDHEAFDTLLRKVDPVIGNLRNVHQAWARNEEKVIETPLMTFTVASWNLNTEDSEKAYGVLDCTAT